MKGFDIKKHFILRKSDRIALLFLLSLAALAMLVIMGIDFMGASRSMTDSDTVRVANTATGAQKAASQRAPVYYRQEEQRILIDMVLVVLFLHLVLEVGFQHILYIPGNEFFHL